METACSWLQETLEGRAAFPLQEIYERHIERDDSFDLSDVLSFLPEKDLPKLVKIIIERVSPTLAYLEKYQRQNETEALGGHCAAVRAASEIVLLLVKKRKTAVPILRPLIIALHDAFLELPNDSQQKISTVCELLWHAGDEERHRVVPYTMLYLLQRSFGEESELRCNKNLSRLPGSVVDIHRVYSMRKALETLELAETAPDAQTIRHLLMRCTTSSVYLKTSEGRKFLAYLLTLNDVKASTFDALLNQLGTVRKPFANFFGMVFLYAWKSKREDWLSGRLMYLSEKAIQAGAEPFSTNLKVVLSTFHANKRVTGVDLLLREIYSPVLFRNLMVANPLVRRNAVIVLSDAFPIHDPGASVQDIERTIEFQCSKFLELLQDPCSTVRLAAIEGTSRVLGLFWELVSSSYAKRVVDLLTSQLAFDASSPRIRVIVFEGLKFLLENHLTHQVLAIALPRLGSLVHDRVERVRLSFLDLLLAVKGKRLRSLRYFDVVHINDLLLRLPTESPAVTAKIMELIRTSYFPLERKQKTIEEVTASQTRACLSLLDTNRDAARRFYRQLYLHVPPGPLLEFAVRMALIGVNTAAAPTAAPVKIRKSRRRNNRRKEKEILAQKSQQAQVSQQAILNGEKENVDPLNDSQEQFEEQDSYSNGTARSSVDQESILTTVSEVFVSISGSLRKPANKGLKEFFEGTFGGEVLRALLLQKDNSLPTRAACWRIASCLSASQIEPLTTIWEEHMASVSEWYTRGSSELEGHRVLVSALLLCGMKWNFLSSMSSFFSSWCDASINGSRATNMGIKSSKRNQRRREKNSEIPRYAVNAKHDILTRAKFLFSLWICGDVILTSEDLHDDFARMTIESDENQNRADTFCILESLRKASVGVLDYFLETYSTPRKRSDTDGLLRPRFLLQALTTTWRVCLKTATCGSSGQRALSELRNLTQCFASNNIWKNASEIDNRFATALANVVLAHCADTVAVTNLTNDDLVRYEGILNCLRAEIVFTGTSEADQLIAEALRLTFLLREQALDTDACTPEASEADRSTKLRHTSNALLSVVCEILSGVKPASDRETIALRKMSRYEQFFRDIVVNMHKTDDMEDFRLVFTKSLVLGFESEDTAEDGIFSRLLCKIVASQIISKKKTAPNLGFRLYSSIVRCFRGLSERSTADECIGNFTRVLVDSIFSHYDENDDQTRPCGNAKECLAMMGSLLEKEFPQLRLTPGQKANNHLIVREAQKVLSLLRNMGEQDVLENKGAPPDVI